MCICIHSFIYIYNAAGFGFIITPTPPRPCGPHQWKNMRRCAERGGPFSRPSLLEPAVACSLLIKRDESARGTRRACTVTKGILPDFIT